MTGTGIAVRNESSTARDQIVRAAAEALLEHGYAGASVRAIAARAGVAIGNLQYYFPTKSGLLVETWRYLTSRSLGELRESLNRVSDPTTILLGGVDAIWDMLEKLADTQLAAFDLLIQAPKQSPLQAYLPELFARYRELIDEQLDRLESEGHVRFAVGRDVLVPLVLNTVLGFGLYYAVTRDAVSCRQALTSFRLLAATLIEPL
ncbi:MAG TPA: TetR/AcrR family transcriptional regulator [Candidatus Dormibacteraeota bacterium]|jgi:AcrR family transcriptional regulator|nr:TetR/AcrR family transcriptional regulator [Candidatus Dormibacteraeota bacterium]